MDISVWWELVLTNENRIASIINKYYPSAVEDFHGACRRKEDSEVHRIIHEAWFRNPTKLWGAPDGWEIVCNLVDGYPH